MCDFSRASDASALLGLVSILDRVLFFVDAVTVVYQSFN